MNRTRQVWRILATYILLAPWMASSATAQAIFPPNGLTAFPAVDADLTLRASVSGGYDVNSRAAPTTSPGTQSSLFQRRSTNLGGNLYLTYSPPEGRRFTFNASGGSSIRRYNAADLILASHFGTAGVTIGLSQHLTATGAVNAYYFPQFQLDLFPAVGQSFLGQTLPLTVDYSLSPHHVLNYAASGAIDYRPTNRSSFELLYSFQDMNTNGLSFRGKTQSAAARYHRNITKGLRARIGYRYQTAEYVDPTTGTARPIVVGDLDAGLDYGLGRGLALSRRTRLTFGFGSTAYADYGITRYRLTGNANLAYQLARNWTAGLAYRRGVHFFDGFAAPIFSDSVTARLGGQLTQRLSAQASVGYFFGGPEDVNSVAQYRSNRSVLTLRSELTTRLSAFAEYFYYHYEFNDATFLIQGAPPRLSRQGVRVGLNLALPLGPVRRTGGRPVPGI